mmetsp:Transcript_12422/g.33220  ORF Transcript_12422/g.33220 Transcript_12422/m.33220 type:complete len:110 (-) Transcript_12422:527-856(-)
MLGLMIPQLAAARQRCRSLREAKAGRAARAWCKKVQGGANVCVGALLTLLAAGDHTQRACLLLGRRSRWSKMEVQHACAIAASHRYQRVMQTAFSHIAVLRTCYIWWQY